MTLLLEKETVAELVRIVVAAGKAAERDALTEELPLALMGAEVREAADLSALVAELAGEASTDLVLLDLAMPGLSGLAGLLYLRSQFPSVPFVAMSAQWDAALVRRCLAAGAAGFVTATDGVDVVAAAVDAVLDGNLPQPASAEVGGTGDGDAAEPLRCLKRLTPQQLRVLMLLCPGLLNKQIAYELGVSEATVKAHVSAILQKLGVDGRAQAVETLSRINGGQLAPPAS